MSVASGYFDLVKLILLAPTVFISLGELIFVSLCVVLFPLVTSGYGSQKARLGKDSIQVCPTNFLC